MAQSPSVSESSNDQVGEVLDILASRSSTTLGCPEVLVVWKPSWVPMTHVLEGPILTTFLRAPKCFFLSSAGKLLLPVETDSALADDIAAASERTDRQLKLQARQERGTSKMTLGGVAKQAAPRAQSARDSQKQ